MGPLHLPVCGATEAAERAARIAGVVRVLLCADPGSASGLGELLATLAAGYDHLAAPAPATARVRCVMPRRAALLDLQPISRVLRAIDGQTFTRPMPTMR